MTTWRVTAARGTRYRTCRNCGGTGEPLDTPKGVR